MAPLTWRNVDAPDLSAAGNMMARASQGIVNAFKTGGDIGRGIYADQVDIGSREAMQAAQQFTTSADWTGALANGTAYGNMDPRFINAETLAWGADRRRGLLSEEQIIQNMEIQRNQEARAAAGGGRSGSGGGGRTGGSGGGKSTDESRMEVARLEGLARLAESDGDLEKAREYRESALALSAAGNHRSDFLDSVDAVTGMEADSRAAADAAAAAASAGVADAPLAPPAYVSSYAPAPAVEETPPISAVAGSPVGSVVSSPRLSFSPRTSASSDVAAPPAFAAREAAIMRGSDAPSLTFGRDVPEAVIDIPRTEEPPRLTWGDSAGASAPVITADAPPATTTADAGRLDPTVLGFSPEMRDTPEWGAFSDRVVDYFSYFGDRDEALRANQTRTTLTSPLDMDSTVKTARATLDETLRLNPEFALYDAIPGLEAISAESGPKGVVDEVVKQLGIVDKDDAEGMMNTIMKLAGKHGVDAATAGAAILAYGSPSDRNIGWFNNTYFNEEAADAALEKVSGARSDPRTVIASRNEVGNVRRTLNTLETTLSDARKEVAAAEAGLAKRPNDPRWQERVEAARASVLQADKNLIEYTRLMPDILADMGLEGGPGRTSVEPTIPESLRDVETEISMNRERNAALMAEYGTTEPEFILDRGRFSVGDVDPASPGGMRFATEVLPFFMQDNANQGDKASFFEWVSKSPEASAEIFGRIQEMEYAGEDVDLPEAVENAYSAYTKSAIPEQAIADFTALGFDLSGQPELAAALANDPVVRSKLGSWRNTDNFWTFSSTKASSRAVAQGAIEAAIIRFKKTNSFDNAGNNARPVIQRNGAIGFDNEANDENYWRNMEARG